MVVPVGELDLELDPPEERRRRVEHEAVGAGNAPAELADAAVGVRLPGADELLGLPQLDPHALRRPAVLGVEDVGRDGHEPTLRRKAGGGEAVLPCDLGLVGVHELSAADDVLPCDDEPVDAVRPRKDEACDRIGGTPELEPVRAPDRQVGPLRRFEAPDVVASQRAGPSS